ncbi:MAG TPA: hypothetical protein VM308_01170 [Sphingomicrobium sp.]|nr:hypothetical protein [Sphingomicrobium sp.]
MSVLWDYFWPVFAAGLVLGAIAGTVAFRSGSKRNAALAVGLAAAFASAALWHGPLGAADRLATRIERDVRSVLVHYEMAQVSGRLHRDPLTRNVQLSGPADDFQREGLVNFMNQLPGVSGAGWSGASGGVPLIVEAAAAALLGYLLGLLLAYLIELRRRYNAEWRW